MAGEVSQPGDYFAMIVANEPVFVLRGEDGELRQKYKHEREKRLREDGNELPIPRLVLLQGRRKSC